MKGAWFGFIFFVAIVLLLGGTVLVGHYPIFQKRTAMLCAFPSVEGLREGDDVRVDGVAQGKVRKLVLTKDGVVVGIELDEPLELHEGYSISVESLSLLGGGVVSIKRGNLKASIVPAPPGGVWAGIPSAGPLGAVSKSLSKYDEALGPLLDHLKNISEKLDKGEGGLAKAFTDKEFYEKLTSTIDKAREAFEKLGSGEAIGLNEKETRDKLKASIDKASDAVNNVNEVFRKLNEKEGTAGKLVNDPKLYDDARDAVAKAKDAIDELEGITKKVKEGDGLAHNVIYKSKLQDDIEAAAANLREITEKINKGEGTLGKAVNDDKLYSSAKGALEGADRVFGDLARTEFKLGGNYTRTFNKDIGLYKMYFEIWPTPDKYFHLGVDLFSMDASGDINFDSKRSDGQDATQIAFDVVAGMRWPWWFDDNLFAYAGLIESTGGMGARYELGKAIGVDHPLDLIVEGRLSHHNFGTQNLDENIAGPLVRAYFKTPLWTPSDDRDDFMGSFVSKFHIFAGGSNLTDEPEGLVGIGFEYADKDLKALTAFASAAH